jgi:hypothetical protein
MQYLDELKALALPSDQFAVFGSGPMAIRDIRKNEDVDVIVLPQLWDELIKAHEVKEDGRTITIGHVEVRKDWTPWFADVRKFIEESDTVDGIRFVKLKHVVEWKTLRNTPKDHEDLDRIRMYMDLYGDGVTKCFE